MTKLRFLTSLLLTAGLASFSVYASEQASIEWANRKGIDDWKVVDSHTVHVQDRHGEWFEAELYHDVPSLEYAIALGFVTGALGELDKFSSIYFNGNTYRFKSFIKLDEDPYAKAAESPAAS